MITPIDQSDANVACNSVPTESIRLRLLVVVHLLLGLAPVAVALFPLDDIRFRPLIFAFLSVPYSQVMLLSFWVGMGTSRVIWRLLGALLGSAYLAIMPVLISIWLPHVTQLVLFWVWIPHAEQILAAERISLYLSAFVVYYVSVMALAGVFWLMRRWYAELCHIHDPRVSARPRVRRQLLFPLNDN
jgi:hypothetical protein